MKCKDCGREITEEENTNNKGKCDRCSIGDYYA
jgi:DNA-directed RNA polymerase subunit RPC12/RpoP